MGKIIDKEDKSKGKGCIGCPVEAGKVCKGCMLDCYWKITDKRLNGFVITIEELYDAGKITYQEYQLVMFNLATDEFMDLNGDLL